MLAGFPSCGCAPLPIANLRHVLAVFADVLLVIDELVPNQLLGVSGARAERGHPIYYVCNKVKTVDVVHHRHIEWGGRCSLFLVAADMEVSVIGPPICQPVTQPGMTMRREDDGFGFGKER